MVLVARRTVTNESLTFAPVRSLDTPYPDIDAVIGRYGMVLPRESIGGAEWALTGTQAPTPSSVGSVRCVPFLEYVDRHVYRGIVTGFGKAFMLSDGERDKIIAEDPTSVEIIEPFVTGKEVRPWAISDKRRWLIVTRIGVEINRYPAVFRHLSRWESELRARDDQGNHWWELRSCT